MTKIEAAAEAIRAAGYDQMARDFVKYPQHRERIARIVSHDVSNRLGHVLGSRLKASLMLAAR